MVPVPKRRKVSHDFQDATASKSEGRPLLGQNVNGSKGTTDTLLRRRIAHESSDDGFLEHDEAGSEDEFAGFDDQQEDTLRHDDADEGHDTSEDGSIADGDTREAGAKASVPDGHTDRGSGDGATASGQSPMLLGDISRQSVFRLQVDNLLRETMWKHAGTEAYVKEALSTVKKSIESIPDKQPLPVSEAEKLLKAEHNVAVPFPSPRPPKDAKYKLEYARPADIQTVGSYSLRMVTREDRNGSVDLAVLMPSSIFQEKDYLNHRYLYKRAYYLACVAAGLVRDSFTMRYEWLGGNSLLPILNLSPTVRGIAVPVSSSSWCIRIIPTISRELFPMGKLLPNKSCIREHTSDDPARLTPTPFYNASVRADSMVMEYAKLLSETSDECEAFREACVLGRIWLRQRGFGSSITGGGFGNFEWAALTAILLQQQAGKATSLSKRQGSYQLFRGVLHFLASHDLTKQPFFHACHSNIREHIPNDESPTFFDGARSLNLLYKMHKGSYKLLRKNARITLNALTDRIFNHFDDTFIYRADMYHFDTHAKVSIQPRIRRPTAEAEPALSHAIVEQLYSVLERGLTDRVSIVVINAPEPSTWSISSSAAISEGPIDFSIGFMVNPLNVSRAVDHGPSADDKEAAASFRDFWGSKSELRRFKDGSILESVLWSTKNTSQSVFEQIVRYLLHQHLDKDTAQSLRLPANELEKMLPSNPTLSTVMGTSLCASTVSAFSTLEQDIRSLEGLPLAIRHIQAADEQLRHTSIYPPTFDKGMRMTKPADFILHFEGSARWPDDLFAIQRTKIAFLLKTGELLEGSVAGLTASIGVENQESAILNQGFLDIFYANGAAFRMRIQHDREQSLLEQALRSKATASLARESAALALSRYKSAFVRKPSHTQVMQKLCSRYLALSPAVRLLKRWFSSHLLSNHFAPETLELFAARTFLHPSPWDVPSSAQNAFLRTLYFLAHWDWRREPQLIDLDDSMDTEMRDALLTRFAAWRKVDPNLNRAVLLVGSSLDTDGTGWTDWAHPPKVAATRMTYLAKEAVRVSIEDSGKKDLNALFSSSLKDYDFVLRLEPRFSKQDASRSRSKVGRIFKNLQLQTDASSSREEQSYDPGHSLLAELEEAYGRAAVFFHGSSPVDDESFIAGLWKPEAVGNRQWRQRLGYSTRPLSLVGDQPAVDGHDEAEVGDQDDAVTITLCKEAVLHEIAQLAGDLVRVIEVNR